MSPDLPSTHAGKAPVASRNEEIPTMVSKAVSAAIVAVAMLAVAACGGSNQEQSTLPEPEPVQSTDDSEVDSDPQVDTNPTPEPPRDTGPGLAEVIYFEFDSSSLSDTARGQLQQNAEWLRANSNRRITIEGHTDEVGTPEYNLALGERRALTTKQYLVQLGIDESRIEIVTYGEERPASQDDAENRRSVFVPLN
jgi:peptidoglycan-associated lipoprotein